MTDTGTSETGTPYLPDGYTGPTAACADCGNTAPAEPVKRHQNVEGPLCQPCRNGQLMLHMLCWSCGAYDGLMWSSTKVVEYARITGFSGDDEPIVDDHSWDSDTSDNGDAWVNCRCGQVLMRDVGYTVGR